MERTRKQYKHLSAEERATIMLMQREGNNMREVGRYLNRSASTISRELARDLATESGYTATLAGILKRMHPDQSEHWVSHETIYHTLYAMPHGELRRELIACLRWSRDIRLFKHFSA